MKNVKKIAFYSVLLFSILKNSCGNEHLGERATRLAANAFLESTKAASEAGIAMSQRVGVEATKVAADAGIEITKITTQAALEATKLTTEAGIKATENGIIASEKLGVGVAKELAPIAGAAVCIYGAATVVEMGSRLYAYHNPDEEKIARNNKAREINEFIDAKRNFRNCLKNNIKTERSASGIPTACQEPADMFAMIAGKSELDGMTETFKSLFQK